MDDQNDQGVGVDIADTLELALRKPVTVAGKSYDRLILREPLAGEMEAASRAASGVGGLISLIVLTAGVPRGVPEAMASRDLARADAFFNTFLVPQVEQGDGDDLADELTITLRKPVTIGKGDSAVTYDTLELSEPTGGQKDKASREPSDMRAAIALVSTIGKIPRLAVERMCRRDFEEACNFLASFNVAGQTTGATLQPS